MEIKMLTAKTNIGVYIHWPFCKVKCPYCDFNSHVRDNIQHDVWINAYILVIDYYKHILASYTIDTIFFGGGTPSLAEPKFVANVIHKLSTICVFTDNIEITLEANPTSTESKKLNEIKAAGVNRISLGIQSFNPEDLRFLGRNHTVTESINALQIVAKIFDNYSFDLIYTLPNQQLQIWDKELRYALQFISSHISLYQLTVEPGTTLARNVASGHIIMPDQDFSADMYELTNSIVNEYDIKNYEISNYAKNGMECRHNLNYWNYGDYIGIGPGAHTRLTQLKIPLILPLDVNNTNTNNSNEQGTKHIKYIKNSLNNENADSIIKFPKSGLSDFKLPEKWLNSVMQNGHGIEITQQLSQKEMIMEQILMGLRLKTGISAELLYSPTYAKYINYSHLNELLNDELLIMTKQSKDYSNEVVDPSVITYINSNISNNNINNNVYSLINSNISHFRIATSKKGMLLLDSILEKLLLDNNS